MEQKGGGNTIEYFVNTTFNYPTMAGNGTRIGKVNIDEQPELADQFGVDTIPSLFLFRNGQHGDKLVAPSSQAQLEA